MEKVLYTPSTSSSAVMYSTLTFGGLGNLKKTFNLAETKVVDTIFLPQCTFSFLAVQKSVCNHTSFEEQLILTYQEHLNLVTTNTALGGYLHPVEFLMFSPSGAGSSQMSGVRSEI